MCENTPDCFGMQFKLGYDLPDKYPRRGRREAENMALSMRGGHCIQLLGNGSLVRAGRKEGRRHGRESGRPPNPRTC